jgi:hypothetical protein
MQFMNASSLHHEHCFSSRWPAGFQYKPPMMTNNLRSILLTLCFASITFAQTPVKFDQRVNAEVVRVKKTRIEGGDFDDKKDRIVLKVKLTNSDMKLSYPNYKGEIYMLAESMIRRQTLQLLGSEKFEFSLEPRGTFEHQTEEVVTAWDNSGAIFGAKYDGWIFLVRDSSGEIVLKKASSPTNLQYLDKLPELKKGKFYSKKFEPLK